MQRITPLLLSAAVLSVSAVAGCHSDDHDRHHTKTDSSDTYYDRSQTTSNTDLRTRESIPPVGNAAGAGTGGANESGVTLPQPGTSGTRAPTQSANPDPHANTPLDATDAKASDR